MKISKKLTLTLLVIAIIPLLLVYFFISYTTGNIIEQKIINEYEAELTEEVNTINQILEQYKLETILVKQLPPMQGILRAEESGIDPFDNSTLQNWIQRYQSIFSTIASLEPHLTQIRYIDQQGLEYIRINKIQNQVSIVTPLALQNKSSRPYFKETLQLEEYQVYVSPVELNQENGIIQKPYTTVIRFGTPVYDVYGNKKGIIIINLDFKPLFSSASQSLLGEIILIDQDGNYLAHPDATKEMSHELGTGYNMFIDQPELKENLQQHDQLTYYDADSKQYRVWKKIFPYPDQTETYWVLISTIEEEKLLGELYGLRKSFFLFMSFFLIITFFIVFFLSKKISTPLSSLTKSVKQIPSGKKQITLEPSLEKLDDEIGSLSRTIKFMVERLQENEQELKQNIKDLKLLDKQKDQFVSVLSHELKSPLVPIMGYIEMIQKGEFGKVTKKQKEKLNICMRNAKSLQQLINNFLDLSRLDLKRMQFTFKKQNLAKILREITDNLAPLAKENYAQLALSIPDKAPINCDKEKLTQAITNIIKNAIIYGKPGKKNKIRIIIQEKNKKFYLTISDTGQGIPATMVSKLFKRYYRAEQAIRSPTTGTGLGLIITKKLLEVHHATIQVRSKKGVGTTVQVVFKKYERG